MSDNKDKKVLLSLRDVVVQFNVRGRILTAIRNVSLDVYENESLAIVGESGSGKSVLTKTFAGMLDANGFIPQGSIIFSDDEISKTDVKLTPANRRLLDYALPAGEPLGWIIVDFGSAKLAEHIWRHNFD